MDMGGTPGGTPARRKTVMEESSWQVQETAKRPVWPEKTWGRGTEIWPARQPGARVAVLALTPWDGELSRVRAKECRDVA